MPAAARIPLDQLIANARGLALAAFAPIETTAALLGGDRQAAQQLQEAASADWSRLQSEIRRARGAAE